MSSFHPSQTGGQCESIDHGKCLVFIPATSTSPGSLPNMLGTPSQTTCFRSWRRLPQLYFSKAIREVILDKSEMPTGVPRWASLPSLLPHPSCVRVSVGAQLCAHHVEARGQP